MARQRRPVSVWATVPRMASMVVFLAILGAAIYRSRDASLWSWVGPEEPQQLTTRDDGSVVPQGETTSLISAEERQAIATDFETVTDRTPMQPGDMDAYWRLMKWAEESSFQTLRSHARNDALFTNFWESPEEWRGELFRLNLQIRRIITYDVPENDLGLTHVYEAWATTDESKTFPYVVVFSELPEGMTLGPDVREQGTFAGFFLKVMSYQAADHPRGAPLLIGSIERRASPSANHQGEEANDIGRWLLIVCASAIVISLLATSLRLVFGRSKPTRSRISNEEVDSKESVQDWLSDLNDSSDRKETPDSDDSRHS